MFDSSSASLRPYTQELLRSIGATLNGVDHTISLSGHTDSTRYAGGERGFSNWELSANRANASRRELVMGGLAEGKIVRVVSLSDTLPLDPANPTAPLNRRISIIVLNKQAEAALRGNGNKKLGTEIPRDSLRITEGTAVSAPTSGLHGWVPPRLLPYVRSLSSLAAAACILLGMAIFYYSVSQSPATKRDALAAKAGTEAGVVRWTWSGWGSKPNQISNGTTGDVVWDTAEQSGFMTFAGLPRIDETKVVFQLWIIDADRPGEKPVDGGTFTAAGAGQVIVPYYARVKVGRPAAFG